MLQAEPAGRRGAHDCCGVRLIGACLVVGSGPCVLRDACVLFWLAKQAGRTVTGGAYLISLWFVCAARLDLMRYSCVASLISVNLGEIGWQAATIYSKLSWQGIQC